MFKSTLRRGNKDKTSQEPVSKLTDGEELLLAEHTKKLRECGEAVLGKYVALQGRDIAQVLQLGLETTNRMACIEANDVTADMKAAVARINQTDTIVSLVFDDKVSLFSYAHLLSNCDFTVFFSTPPYPQIKDISVDATRKKNYAARTLCSTGGPNVAKLFAEKFAIMGSVELFRNAIMLGIAKLIAKSYAENLRTSIFKKIGLQQIEVNANYLNRVFANYVIDEPGELMLGGLMVQVIASATCRCLEPARTEKEVCK